MRRKVLMKMDRELKELDRLDKGAASYYDFELKKIAINISATLKNRKIVPAPGSLSEEMVWRARRGL